VLCMRSHVSCYVGVLKQTLNYHSSPITCLDFSSNDELLLSGSADKSIVFWDPKAGRVIVGC
jgi:WD40 repeat protein